MLSVNVPNKTYWKEMICCQAACPVHTDSRGYVRAIAEGNYELAYLIARGPNPLASICSMVCGAPCELECRRGDVDKPIAIRALKRFVCEKFGPESKDGSKKNFIEYIKEIASKYSPPCEDTEELLTLLQSLMKGDIPKIEKKSVGIIGSGPAGLSAAHDLALLGADVTIYELEPILAGMLVVGIPQYRLSRELVMAEVEVIQELGVKSITNCEIGKDKTLAELREMHDAVIIAVGAKRSRMIPFPGVDAKGVLGGVEFLRDISLGNPPSLGKKVVVIGGGNVAYDVGRTVVRQISIDAARTALREEKVGEVHLCSLESLDEMPADDVEIIEGDEEGVVRVNSVGPVEILHDGNLNVTGVVFQKCTRVFDENKRFAPEFDDSIKTTIECDNVILSIGQGVDLSFVDAQRDGLDVTERGFIACDAETGVTNAQDVFISGDLAYGPKLLIHAVASGKKVARAVYEQLTGRAITHEDVELHLAIPDYEREYEYEHKQRVKISTIPASERIKSQTKLVELGFTEEEACYEASRCLDCGVNTIFDGKKCILCGGCADVCPQLCLRLVSVDRLPAGNGISDVVNIHLNEKTPEEASAILKDETSCIRCALCAERCPTGAITMERFRFKEVLLCQNV